MEKKLQKPYPADYNLRFMASSLSNLAEGIHKIKCKDEHDNEKCEACKIKQINCDCYLEYANVKDNTVQMFMLQL